MGGHRDGEIRFWSLAIPKDEQGQEKTCGRTGWLKLAAKYHVHREPVLSIATTRSTQQHCWTADEGGMVLRWTVSEHQEHWIDNKDVTQCPKCSVRFSYRERRHHCRKCGGIFCEKCSKKRMQLQELGYSRKVRVCDNCFEQKYRLLEV